MFGEEMAWERAANLSSDGSSGLGGRETGRISQRKDVGVAHMLQRVLVDIAVTRGWVRQLAASKDRRRSHVRYDMKQIVVSLF